MLTVRLDPNGSHQVRWPETLSDLIILARRFTAREYALPADQRMKDIPAIIQSLLNQVEAIVGSVTDGETGRATAAETLRQKLTEARPLVNLLVLRLKTEYRQNLAQLEGWGLSTRQTPHGVTVRKPNTPKEQIAFLRAYIAKESTLIEGQQIADPPLTEVQALLEEIEDARALRTIGRNQRELGVEQRGDIQNELLRWLQMAAMLLVMQNGGVVSTALQQHGYIVVARTTNGTPPLPVGEPAGDPPTAPQG